MLQHPYFLPSLKLQSFSLGWKDCSPDLTVNWFNPTFHVKKQHTVCRAISSLTGSIFSWLTVRLVSHWSQQKNVAIYKRQVPFSVVGISTQKIVLSLFLSTRKEANLPALGLLPVLHLAMWAQACTEQFLFTIWAYKMRVIELSSFISEWKPKSKAFTTSSDFR